MTSSGHGSGRGSTRRTRLGRARRVVALALVLVAAAVTAGAVLCTGALTDVLAWLGVDTRAAIPEERAETREECRARGCRLSINTYRCVCLRPRPLRAQTRYDSRTGITWVQIKGGAFQMGSTSGDSDELPVHRVHVPTFWMARTEVTVDQYARCVRAGSCSRPGPGTYRNWGKPGRGSHAACGNLLVVDLRYCNWGKPGRGSHPVNCVSWGQAQAYARWAGGRLPSEAEWEYAARSRGKPWRYPWGNATASCARAIMAIGWEPGEPGCGRRRTWPVCSKPRGNTKQGLCDMAGNVWEWVEDTYHSSYQGAPTDGSAWVGGGSYRVLRGGTWYFDDAWSLRATCRRRDYPCTQDHLIGFRPVRSYP